MKENIIKKLFLNYPITINEDLKSHKKIFFRGFVSATIYSILYGIYEYYVAYNYIRLVDIVGVIGNWVIMYIGLLLVVGISTRFSIEQMIMGLLYMAMFEDVIFWMSKWIDTGVYPYPAGDWWDVYFASFRVLGGLGRPIPFWPYIPIYYIPGFLMVIIFYISSYIGPKSSRISAWVLGPLFLAVLAGTMVNNFAALIILITLPSVLYSYVIILLVIKKKLIKREDYQ